MKRSSPLSFKLSDQMPIYNRSYSHRHHSNGVDGEISLSTIQKKVFLEREVKADDTLQSIALEYNVPVAELKRINNIHKDNEIHARKVLKVPSSTLALLLEQEYFSKEEPSILQGEDSEGGGQDAIVETVNKSTCQPCSSSDSSSEDVIFSANSDNISKYHFTPIKPGDDSEEDLLLQAGRTSTNTASHGMSCNGADWGINWSTLIAITVLLGIGGPLIFLFFYMWRAHSDSGSS